MDEFMQTNEACCRLSRLAKDERLTDVERAIFEAAWRVASEASSLVLKRTMPAEAAE